MTELEYAGLASPYLSEERVKKGLLILMAQEYVRLDDDTIDYLKENFNDLDDKNKLRIEAEKEYRYREQMQAIAEGRAEPIEPPSYIPEGSYKYYEFRRIMMQGKTPFQVYQEEFMATMQAVLRAQLESQGIEPDDMLYLFEPKSLPLIPHHLRTGEMKAMLSRRNIDGEMLTRLEWIERQGRNPETYDIEEEARKKELNDAIEERVKALAAQQSFGQDELTKNYAKPSKAAESQLIAMRDSGLTEHTLLDVYTRTQRLPTAALMPSFEVFNQQLQSKGPANES